MSLIDNEGKNYHEGFKACVAICAPFWAAAAAGVGLYFADAKPSDVASAVQQTVSNVGSAVQDTFKHDFS